MAPFYLPTSLRDDAMRFLSFRFDDGFLDGAMKACDILENHRATFFIVGDRTLGIVDFHDHPLLRGRRFGALQDWQNFAARGHDIQPHSFTHRNFGTLDKATMEEEMIRSRDVVREIHDGPYIFGFPFNEIPDGLSPKDFGFAAAGFVSTQSPQSPVANPLDHRLDRFRLTSWAVRERDLHTLHPQLAGIPDETWVILGLHSLDGEGWEPWTATGFAALVDLVPRLGFRIATIREMVNEHLTGRPPTSPP